MVDLFCGLGGWTEGGLAEGYFVAGFDIEEHVYGEARYPGHLVIQDVTTLHGSQFKDAALIVASPPCQKYSYMAMPWTRSKAMAAQIRADTTGEALADLNRLFQACFRIQREASEAAGRHIPMVVENVRGAIPWVGRSTYNYGSYYLWGDIPLLMPSPCGARKVPGFRFDGHGGSFQTASVKEGFKTGGMNWSDPAKSGQDFTRIAGIQAARDAGMKNTGGSWFKIGSPGQKVTGNNPVHALHLADGIKGSDGNEHDHPNAFGWKKPRTSSHSSARKQASAMIAKIPLTLSQHVARMYKPRTDQ